MGFFSGILGGLGKAASFFAPAGVGEIISGIAGGLGQDETNQANQNIANANNATSIELANSAYQRRVKDLAAAGLNPMLAYQQGGAQVPSLVTPQVNNSTAAGFQSALTHATIEKTKAETQAASSSAHLNDVTAGNATLEGISKGIDLSRKQAEQNFTGDASWLNIAGAEADARGARAKLDFEQSSSNRKTLRALNAYATDYGYPTLDAALRDTDFHKLLKESDNVSFRNIGIKLDNSLLRRDVAFGFNRAQALSHAWGSFPNAAAWSEIGAGSSAAGVGAGLAGAGSAIKNVFRKPPPVNIFKGK
ncbi:MAG: DNA pilot protein [Microviridae sp.]|nr:MAG: DNA pilot protein [Microviridae sp.]